MSGDSRQEQKTQIDRFGTDHVRVPTLMRLVDWQAGR